MPHPQPSPEALGLIGQVIGDRYEVVGFLGVGPLANVFEVYREDMGQRSALKMFQRHNLVHPALVERFLREIRAAARLQHPNIINVYDSGRMDDGRHYYAMELLAGIPLRAVTNNHAGLRVDRALRIIRQVAAATSAIHAADMVHRDLSPDNIILSRRAGERDFVTLRGFELTEAIDRPSESTRGDARMGSPQYLAPESNRSNSGEPTADVYAMGCILWEVLTGKPPYDAPSPMEIARAHLSEPVPEWPTRTGHVSEPLRQLIRRMMAKDRAVRPADGQAVLDALDALGGGFGSLEGPPTRRRRISDRHLQVTPRYESAGTGREDAGTPSALRGQARAPQANRRHRRETPQKRTSQPRLQDFVQNDKGDRAELAATAVRRVPAPTARPHASRPIAKGHVVRADGRKSTLLVDTAGPAGVTATLLAHGKDVSLGVTVEISLPDANGRPFVIAARIAKTRVVQARGPMTVALELDPGASTFETYRAAAKTWRT